MPMTWGVFRSRVLLPAEALAWPADRLRAVLLHESGHVRRADCLAGWIARLTVAVYWSHPLAWAVAARLRREQEAACDDLVLRHGERQPDYAGHLMHVLAAGRGGGGANVAAWGAVPMARAGGMEARIRAILDDRAGRRLPLTRLAAILLAVAAVAVALPLAMARATAVSRDDSRGSSSRPPSPATPLPTTRPLTPASVLATASTYLPATAQPAIVPFATGPAMSPAMVPATAGGLRMKHAKRVLDAAGLPAVGARLWLAQDYPSFPICQPDTVAVNVLADTGPDGRADVDWPADAKTDLVVHAAGPAPEFVRAAALAADRPYVVRLSVGQPITGTARQPDGRPVAGAAGRMPVGGRPQAHQGRPRRQGAPIGAADPRVAGAGAGGEPGRRVGVGSATGQPGPAE